MADKIKVKKKICMPWLFVPVYFYAEFDLSKNELTLYSNAIPPPLLSVFILKLLGLNIF